MADVSWAGSGPSPAGLSSGPGPETTRRMYRSSTDKVAAGVCGGLAEHLGVSALVVRLAFVGLTLGTGGGGVFVYGFLWALAPRDVEVPDRPSPQRRVRWRPSSYQVALLVGVVLLVVGVRLWQPLQDSGVDLSLAVPALAVIVGVALAWSQLDAPLGGPWGGRSRLARVWAVLRIVVGVALTAVGVVVLVSQGQGLAGVWNGALAALAVLVGVAGLAAPWVVRGYRRFQQEQLERVRATERADIAAHLHDSVLQTLALIQRRSDDQQTVQRLARSQERELRTWLYAGNAAESATLASAVAAVVHEVEDDHGIPVELVVTGDTPLSGPADALVMATREAVLNAVRHGQPPVSVYVEAGASGVEVYVRDHGPGFDLDRVRPDRLGVRESILGRMHRHGGSATVRRLDRGTEIALTLPSGSGEPAVTASPPAGEESPSPGLGPAAGGSASRAR